MEELEEIRNNLYIAIDKGDQKEVLNLSRKLDKIIVNRLKEERLEKVRSKS